MTWLVRFLAPVATTTAGKWVRYGWCWWAMDRHRMICRPAWDMEEG